MKYFILNYIRNQLNNAIRPAVILLSCMGFICLSPASHAQLNAEDEYKIKAAFVFNIIKFVDWPTHMFQNEDTPIVLGILGQDPFGKFLNFVEEKPIKGRQVVIRYFDTPQDVTACHVLFISRSEKGKLRRYLQELPETGMLTIGDMDDFAQNDGMINLITIDEKIRFEINVDAAKKSGVTISSKLLNLAKIVKSAREREYINAEIQGH